MRTWITRSVVRWRLSRCSQGARYPIGTVACC